MRQRHVLARSLAVLLLAGLVIWLAAPAGTQARDSTRRRIRVPVLMYHYISVPPPDADRYRLDLSVSPDQFTEQLRWLSDHGYTTITLDDLYAALAAGRPLPPRPIVLTFDDGYADAYLNAYHLLRSFNMVGTFFVVTAWMDARQPGYLTWEQARTMAAAGMSIQSHSATHPDLTQGCDYDCLIYQIKGSVESIEGNIGVRPRFFCYPSGRYNQAVMAVLQQVGILAAVTTRPGTLHVSDRPLELPRVRIRNTTRITEFAWLVESWRE